MNLIPFISALHSYFHERTCCVLQKARDLHREGQALQQMEADRTCVAELLQRRGNGKPMDAQSRQNELLNYTASREERVRCFLNALQHKRDTFFSDLSSQAVVA